MPIAPNENSCCANWVIAALQPRAGKEVGPYRICRETESKWWQPKANRNIGEGAHCESQWYIVKTYLALFSQVGRLVNPPQPFVDYLSFHNGRLENTQGQWKSRGGSVRRKLQKPGGARFLSLSLSLPRSLSLSLSLPRGWNEVGHWRGLSVCRFKFKLEQISLELRQLVGDLWWPRHKISWG